MNYRELEDSYLTVAEIAALLKLNQQTVRNWIDQGSLPALRVGRRVRIKRSDLERVLAEGYSAGGSSAAREPSPSAEDFWGGEPVGLAEPTAAPAPQSTPDDSYAAKDLSTSKPPSARRDEAESRPEPQEPSAKSDNS